MERGEGEENRPQISPDLPADIKEAIKTGGYYGNVSTWEKILGQPGAFVRRILHKIIEERGDAPEQTGEDDKKFLDY